MEKEKNNFDSLEQALKDLWKKQGNASVIAAKHTEFMVEPKIFVGTELNPEILKLLVVNYLKSASRQDSGVGNVESSPDKIVIKSKSGKPLVIVRDKKIIQEYLSKQG
jgi:hypothetical protein